MSALRSSLILVDRGVQSYAGDRCPMDWRRLQSESCSHHRSGTHISECAQLVPAGTGTASLNAGLRLTGRGAQRDSMSPLQLAHDHNKQIPSVPNSHCFIMTLRDPAERLMSGFRHGGWPWPFWNFSIFVGALRSGVKSSPPDPLELTQSSARTLFNTSVSRAMKGDKLHPPRTSFFLIPQIAYLRGLNCSHAEMHVLCTCALKSEWAKLRAAFKDDGDANMPRCLPDENRRSRFFNGSSACHGAGCGKVTHMATTKPAEIVDPLDVAFVREHLYPEDAMWHSAHCGAACQKKNEQDCGGEGGV